MHFNIESSTLRAIEGSYLVPRGSLNRTVLVPGNRNT